MQNRPKSRKTVRAWLANKALDDLARAETMIRDQKNRMVRLLTGQVLLEDFLDDSGEVTLLAMGTLLTSELLCALKVYQLRHLVTDNHEAVSAYYAKSQAKIDALLNAKCEVCHRVSIIRDLTKR